ncbi:hypothetical protein [Haloarchaeobius sp. DYHT-AS-18]|uniref:hypothetical protein n=1 Tax=Haloarchaeobius sp. DYHT-AS-18 TaxID=3446117 RepID=UPI003EBD8422
MAFPIALGVGSLPPVERLVSLGIVLVACVLLGARFWFSIAIFNAAMSGGDTQPPESKVNCSACGARNAGSRAECRTCGEPLADE